MTCKLCDKKIFSRGLCSSHYGKAYRGGSINDIADVSMRKHSIDIDTINTELKNAICLECGFVKVKLHSRGHWYCVNSKGYVKKEDRKKSTEYIGGTKLQRRARKELPPFSGNCSICKCATEKPVVDHDHETDILRDYLCHHCNVGLGFFRDNSESMKAAAKYIELHKNTPRKS
jgi:hypothetical protein